MHCGRYRLYVINIGNNTNLNFTVLLGYNDMQFENSPRFRRNIEPPFSDGRLSQARNPPESGGKLNFAKFDVFYFSKPDDVIPTETLLPFSSHVLT